MLQQTGAKRVVGYYRRFLDRFPDPFELATAAPGEVLALWSGLGYNIRALRLREAAIVIASSGWPPTEEKLRALPGVGLYTAAAVACFAFGEQIPTPDTNMRRVLSRWHGEPLAGKALTEAAGAEIPTGRASEWNQAVMDIGATLCKPLTPACERCPVEPWCAGPSTYVPPPSQPPFAGSARQARGAIIRHLVESGPLSIEELSSRIGADRLLPAVERLTEEGLVELAGPVVKLPS